VGKGSLRVIRVAYLEIFHLGTHMFLNTEGLEFLVLMWKSPRTFRFCHWVDLTLLPWEMRVSKNQEVSRSKFLLEKFTISNIATSQMESSQNINYISNISHWYTLPTVINLRRFGVRLFQGLLNTHTKCIVWFLPPIIACFSYYLFRYRLQSEWECQCNSCFRFDPQKWHMMP